MRYLGIRRFTFLSTCVLFAGGILRAEEPEAANPPAEEQAPPQVIEVANGKLRVPAAASWNRVKPKVRIIEVEMMVPPAEGDELAGRITIMSAGGSIRDNIDRWIGQFVLAKAESGEESVKQEELEAAQLKVHLVDISGTYKDRRGPFAPAVERPGYRMLGAIIESEKLGNYFVKFYGPQATVDANAKAFREMIKGIETGSGG